MANLIKRFFRLNNSCHLTGIVVVLILQQFIPRGMLYSQAELEPWGNLAGMRIEGQLIPFETRLSVSGIAKASMLSTAKEKQRPEYLRDGAKQIVMTHLDSLYFKETVEDVGSGGMHIHIEMTAHSEVNGSDVFFVVVLPGATYADASAELIDPVATTLASNAAESETTAGFPAKGVKIKGSGASLEITAGRPSAVTIRRGQGPLKSDTHLYFPLARTHFQNGQTVTADFTIRVTGKVNHDPADIVLHTSEPGRPFAGLGGNFRIQNQKLDPEVIDYCLSNLRVAFSRVELPWSLWQPVKGNDPIDSAKAGKLHPRVLQAMEMAQRLGKKGIPIILSAWFPPNWAAQGELAFRPRPDGVWGNPLEPAVANDIYSSIGKYVEWLKVHYGVTVAYFSFNESDLGINVRQTGEQHATFIKGMGAWFAAHHLTTKLLLGDNSDATTYKFIYPAMDDASTHPFIGAISFHSWRGWDDSTLRKWADAATKLHLPLLVAEGSIDAAAWSYPMILQEESYAMEEINLYTRLLAICEPESILQWQLTSDYSPLSGGGIFGDTSALAPTRRFWNLKQLSTIPKGLFAMKAECDNPAISAALLGNNDKRIYSLQLVNNGASREVHLAGLPATIKMLHITVTAKNKNMESAGTIPVSNGEAKLTLEPRSYTTLSTVK